MKQSLIREWEESNPPFINGHLIIEKWQEKLKTQDRDTSYKRKSKLVIRRNIQHSTGTIL